MNDPATTNTLWGGLTAEVLARLALEDVVISPGSRSTPLTVALGRHPRLRCRVILDERSAAFFALGMAQASHRPVVLVCTSGSAVANYLPAVIEAAESRVPLILLTADRPPELRHRQAGQTIDQLGIYGRFVRWSAEAPVPSAEASILCAWRDLLAQAVDRAQGPEPGPVHLNCPFREPLGPVGANQLNLGEALAPLLADVAPSRSPELIQSRLPELPEHGWIIAGPARPRHPERYVRAVGDLAVALGWPIIADALNPSRHFADLLPVPVISTYDAIVRSPELARRWLPEGILQLGPLPTSKGLRYLLSRWQLPTWIAAPNGLSFNAVAAPAVSLGVGPEQLVPTVVEGRNGDWWQELASLDTRVRLALAGGLAASPHSEAAISAALFEALPAETPVFVASSMPVRDAEYFWGANAEHRPVYFNRGANGIDGTLSTALGVAEASSRPSVLVTGDLALLHDTNGMLLAHTSFGGSLTVVCVNNGGGGIFHHLPVVGESDIFEDLFATPQSVDFRLWAEAYRVPYRLANNLDELLSWVRVLPDRGLRLLEVRTDREFDARFRKDLFTQVMLGLG